MDNYIQSEIYTMDEEQYNAQFEGIYELFHVEHTSKEHQKLATEMHGINKRGF